MFHKKGRERHNFPQKVESGRVFRKKVESGTIFRKKVDSGTIFRKKVESGTIFRKNVESGIKSDWGGLPVSKTPCSPPTVGRQRGNHLGRPLDLVGAHRSLGHRPLRESVAEA
jgi:hypothetical protein